MKIIESLLKEQNWIKVRKMRIINTFEKFPINSAKSIFLAGPSIRLKPNEVNTKRSWRKDALEILEKEGFSGDVFVPEYKNDKLPIDFNLAHQVDWETKGLDKATVILFWINRRLKDNEFLALTTNIEFGIYLHSGKIVVGAPVDADKNDYLKEQCKRNNIKWHDTLQETVEAALEMV